VPLLTIGPNVRAEDEEGWYTDPFGRHEVRWISDGKPTKLVRDGKVERYDDPPDEPTSRTPVTVEEPNARAPRDLKRADQAEANEGLDEEKVIDTAFDVMTENWPRF